MKVISKKNIGNKLNVGSKIWTVFAVLIFLSGDFVKAQELSVLCPPSSGFDFAKVDISCANGAEYTFSIKGYSVKKEKFGCFIDKAKTYTFKSFGSDDTYGSVSTHTSYGMNNTRCAGSSAGGKASELIFYKDGVNIAETMECEFKLGLYE